MSELSEIRDGMSRVAEKMTRLAKRLETEPSDFEAVGAFHSKFGLPVSDAGREPTTISRDAANFRLKFLIEELTEIAAGYGIKMDVTLEYGLGRQQDLPQIADGLVDLVYVALGTAHMHALPWPALFAEVQRANMSKERAKPDGSNSLRKSSLDVVKPPDFRPPNIIEVLMAKGWKGPELPLHYSRETDANHREVK